MFRPLIVGAIASALGGGHANREGLAWSRIDAPDVAAQLVLTGGGSDDPWLAFACRPGSGAVDVIVVGAREDGAVIQLHSGKVWNRYAGVGVEDEDIPGAFEVRARLAAVDPVLTRFAETGELRIVLGERRIKPPNGFAPAHDFLKACSL